jgi:hypothetical protein
MPGWQVGPVGKQGTPDHRSDQLMDGRPHPLERQLLGAVPGRPGQVGEVGAAGGVELENPSQGVEDRLRRATVPALLQAGVVIDAHTCELGDLLPTQAAHPAAALTGVAGDARGLRRHVRPALPQKATQICMSCHTFMIAS